MTTPPLARAAPTMAICRAVARTSNWPMAACAVCGAFRSAGKTEVADGHGHVEGVVEAEELGLLPE